MKLTRVLLVAGRPLQEPIAQYGTFVPLGLMDPDADVPVVLLSLVDHAMQVAMASYQFPPASQPR